MSSLKLYGSTSGYVEIVPEATAGNNSVTLPNGSGTLVAADGSGNITITGVTTVSAGSTAAPSITPSGDSNTGIFFPSADTIAFAEGGSEAARFDSSGRLLVGTSTASGIHLLQVNGTATASNGQLVGLSDLTGGNQDLSSSGYQKLPGGLIIQWGAVAGASNTNLTFTLPIAFPTACLSATATVAVTTGFTAETGIDSVTASSIIVNHRAGTATSIYIIAVGH